MWTTVHANVFRRGLKVPDLTGDVQPGGQNCTCYSCQHVSFLPCVSGLSSHGPLEVMTRGGPPTAPRRCAPRRLSHAPRALAPGHVHRTGVRARSPGYTRKARNGRLPPSAPVDVSRPPGRCGRQRTDGRDTTWAWAGAVTHFGPGRCRGATPNGGHLRRRKWTPSQGAPRLAGQSAATHSGRLTRARMRAWNR